MRPLLVNMEKQLNGVTGMCLTQISVVNAYTNASQGLRYTRHPCSSGFCITQPYYRIQFFKVRTLLIFAIRAGSNVDVERKTKPKFVGPSPRDRSILWISPLLQKFQHRTRQPVAVPPHPSLARKSARPLKKLPDLKMLGCR